MDFSIEPSQQNPLAVDILFALAFDHEHKLIGIDMVMEIRSLPGPAAASDMTATLAVWNMGPSLSAFHPSSF